MLVCPVCKKQLYRDNKSYKCINNHNYDLSKEGYLNLNMKNSNNTGDEKEMIKSRTDFLSKNYYLFLRDEINHILDNLKPTNFVDLACGQGYYTKSFNIENKIGIDLSKNGLKYAAKNDKSTLYVLSSIFNTPIDNNSVDAILTCFAPIAKEEIVRILKKDGYFILIRPGKNHLFELKKAVYDTPYLNDEEAILIEGLSLTKEYTINNKFNLNNEDLNSLFTMTPYYHTTSQKDKDKLLNVNNLDITFEFLISIYKK